MLAFLLKIENFLRLPYGTFYHLCAKKEKIGHAHTHDMVDKFFLKNTIHVTIKPKNSEGRMQKAKCVNRPSRI